MIIGIPREIKNNEFRVALTPDAVKTLSPTNTILVENQAGEGSGFADGEYEKAGAAITDKKSLFEKSDLILKVKEPLKDEFDFFRSGQMLFTFLHLAANPEVLEFLLNKKITALAYETLSVNNQHPILAPMSEVAGRMAPLVASYYLQKPHGGSGILPSGIPGTSPANAVILGAGIVGSNAARICHGLGMNTTVLDINQEKLRQIDNQFCGNVRTLFSSNAILENILPETDLLVGAVYLHGKRTPVIVTADMVKNLMKKGSVIVDVSVDQGGCIETIRPTTHENPVYDKHGVIHYGVANMPGAFPRTSTIALVNATLPYIQMLADSAALDNQPLLTALNTKNGEVILAALKH